MNALIARCLLLQMLMTLTLAASLQWTMATNDVMAASEKLTPVKSSPLRALYYRNLRSTPVDSEPDPLLSQFSTAQLTNMAMLLSRMQKDASIQLSPEEEAAIRRLLHAYNDN